MNGLLGDVWLFNTQSTAWSRLEVTGAVPAAREMAAAVMVGPQQMLVCGGRAAEAVSDDVALLDLQQSKWVARGKLGGPLCAHTAVVMQLPGGRHCWACCSGRMLHPCAVWG